MGDGPSTARYHGSMRIALACLLTFLLLAPAPARAEDPKPVKPQPPATLGEIEQRLGELAKRIADLVAVAKQDPDEIKIAMYAKYGPKDLKSTRGRVRAEDLVDFMSDPAKNFNVREMAMKVLVEARWRPDPDLSDEEKKGPYTKRGYFFDKKVAKHLRDDDRASRKLAHELLLAYYGDAAKRLHPEIKAFKDTDVNSCKAARDAWGRFLKKR